MLTWVLVLSLAPVAILIAAELYMRFVVGLGDPPLWRFDGDYEYILQANQRCRRFGNDIFVNRWSMRSRDADANKTVSGELRVLVLGDSIVHGGPKIDDDDLATTLLERRLQAEFSRPVWVGNIAAGSWGPPNLLAYLRKHGLFDADVVMVVINSADYFKELQFRDLDLNRPTRRPVLALEEIFNNYVRRRVRKKLRTRVREARQAARTGEQSDAAMRELIALVLDQGAAIVVLQHLSRDEIDSSPRSGYAEFQQITRSFGLEPVNLGPAFAQALQRGDDPFEDGLHPNRLGQQILADVLHREARRVHSA